jgi:site-specific DNA-cytosine methylase
MNVLIPTRRIEYRAFYLFCGLGGNAAGVNKSHARIGHLEGAFRCIGGVDSDPAAVRDFRHFSDVAGTVLDLFAREDYVAFHGKEPPDGWREATADDIRAAAGGERPHLIFTSPPCKGFSGLLSQERSTTARYQALNRLAVRGIRLALEAWGDNPPEFFLLENVPRIMTRGSALLDQIDGMLQRFGYATAPTVHDCGELGGLGQTRKRFLMVARHRAKVPPFLYQPPRKPLKSVGEVIGGFPLPGDMVAGPMHRSRELQWKTWVRLSLVEAGGDWRSLKKLRVVDGVLADYAILPDRYGYAGALGVTPWDDHASTVTGMAHATRGAHSVADPRIDGAHHGVLGVTPWSEPAGVVQGSSRPGNGRFSVADPRCHGYAEYSQYGVLRWGDVSGAVSGQSQPGGGRYAIADPRVTGTVVASEERDGDLEGRSGLGGIRGERRGTRSKSRPSRTHEVRNAPEPGADTPADREAVSDGVPGSAAGIPTDSGSRLGSRGVRGPAAGGNGFATPERQGDGLPRVEPALVDAEGEHRGQGDSRDAGAGRAAAPGHVHGGDREDDSGVADGNAGAGPEAGRHARFSVGGSRAEDLEARTVAPQRTPFSNIYRVVAWDQPSQAVTGGGTPTSGGIAIADPRPGLTGDAYKTAGHYGVVPWDATSRAVTGTAGHDNGPFSVADPRGQTAENYSKEIFLPAADARLVAVIRSLDGTWHRPFTTLELAALQGLAKPDEPTLILDGSSDSAWRERIGNAIPKEAAEAIGNVIVTTLLLVEAGETFVLSSDPIWVSPLERDLVTAIAVDTPVTM